MKRYKVTKFGINKLSLSRLLRHISVQANIDERDTFAIGPFHYDAVVLTMPEGFKIPEDKELQHSMFNNISTMQKIFSIVIMKELTYDSDKGFNNLGFA